MSRHFRTHIRRLELLVSVVVATAACSEQITSPATIAAPPAYSTATSAALEPSLTLVAFAPTTDFEKNRDRASFTRFHLSCPSGHVLTGVRVEGFHARRLVGECTPRVEVSGAYSIEGAVSLTEGAGFPSGGASAQPKRTACPAGQGVWGFSSAPSAERPGDALAHFALHCRLPGTSAPGTVTTMVLFPVSGAVPENNSCQGGGLATGISGELAPPSSGTVEPSFPVFYMNCEFAPPDLTGPTVKAFLKGATSRMNNWFTTPFTLSWLVQDAETEVIYQFACPDIPIVGDTRQVYTYACTGGSGGGETTTEATFEIKVDITKPVVTIEGNAGLYGTGELIRLNCSATDAMSGIQATDCNGEITPFSHKVPGTYTLTRTATDVAGHVGEATITYVVEQRDNTAPRIDPLVTGVPGAGDWYVSKVSVSWNVTDDESTPTPGPGCGLTEINDDTKGRVLTCEASSAGGTGRGTVTIRRDATRPDVAFSNNRNSYTVDQAVDISCNASDATSGLAHVEGCAAIRGNAFDFMISPTANSYTASATDNAGNNTTTTASFTIVVTSRGMQTLVSRMVTNAGIAKSLNDKLAAIADAAARGNMSAKAGELKAFVNQVDAQAGKSISATDAAVLIRLAREL